MRTQLHIARGIILAVLTAGPLAAQTNQPVTTHAAPPAVDRVKADDCIAHLEKLLEKVAEMDPAASDSSAATAVSECLRDKLAKLRSLVEIAGTARRWMSEAAARGEEDDSVVAAEYSKILLACERANQIAAAAEQCAKQAAPAPPHTRKSKLIGHRPVTMSRPIAPLPPRQPAERNKQTCLRQGPLACLLADAMELDIAGGTNVHTCAEALTTAGIAPLEGWHEERCATVDDLCVTLVRIMKLEVSQSEDPVAYLDALRNEGLAVDAILPERTPRIPPPLLLESEARALLETGYAVPLTR